MNMRYLMGFAILIIPFLIVGTIEYQEYEDRFNHCITQGNAITDSEVVDRIHYCERVSGYTLPKEDYP